MLPFINPWFPILTGLSGFALTLAYDLLQTSGKSRGRSAVAAGGAVLVSLATLGLFFLTQLPTQSWWISFAGFLIIILAGYMFVFSTVLEIPHGDISSGNETGLIETGSYALTRHPGFFWYLILMSSVILLYRDQTVAVVAAALLLMELIVVTVEDWLLFPKIISGYTEYRRRVPMLFPLRIRNHNKVNPD